MLRADVRIRRGELDLAATLEVAAGQPQVVVGESGAGKTTLLRLLAGLERPDAGRITLGRELWFDAPSRTWVPAEGRAVGYVAQDDALFPHLTALDNVTFGPRAAGLSEPQGRARRALDRLGVGAHGRRRPRELSGGERQRVAIARAIAVEPALLLLDEPLSALDVATRRAVRAELKELIASLSCVTILVTHSPAEALAFGGSIAVLARGTISQQGPADELLRHPRSEFVADFMGLNFLRGTVVSMEGHLAHLRIGTTQLAATTQTSQELTAGNDAFVVVDPRDVVISIEPASGSAQNQLSGPILELAPEPPDGERLRIIIDSQPPLVAEITRAAAERLRLAPGVPVHASFKATGAKAFR